jgi:hypothetical protein
MNRIDYYASPEAVEIIDKLRIPRTGSDASSIINRIIAEWAAGCGDGVPEFIVAESREAGPPVSGISSVHRSRSFRTMAAPECQP